MNLGKSVGQDGPKNQQLVNLHSMINPVGKIGSSRMRNDLEKLEKN